MAKKSKKLKKEKKDKKAKKARKKHSSLAEVQGEALAAALELIRGQHGYATLAPGTVEIGGEPCEPAAVNSTGKKIVEIHALAGPLDAVGADRIAADVLELAAIRKQPGSETARGEIYFVDAEALESVPGWIAAAATEFGVGLKLVDEFPEELRVKLIAAREREND